MVSLAVPFPAFLWAPSVSHAAEWRKEKPSAERAKDTDKAEVVTLPLKY